MSGRKYVIRLPELDTYSPPLHHGTVNRRLVGRENGSGKIELIIGEIQPGGGAYPHTHDSDQACFVLTGRCLLTIGESVEEAGPDCAFFLPAGLEHKVEVMGEEVLRLLVIYSPPLER
jgi:quercetin dioxygenase-like cupin family protein